jgi:hypothetical protein
MTNHEEKLKRVIKMWFKKTMRYLHVKICRQKQIRPDSY